MAWAIAPEPPWPAGRPALFWSEHTAFVFGSERVAVFGRLGLLGPSEQCLANPTVRCAPVPLFRQ